MAFKLNGWSGYQNPDPSAFARKKAPHPGKELPGSRGPMVKSYEQAYKDRGSRYKDMNLEDYTTEAKRQMKVYKETGKWDVKKSYKPSESKKTPPKKNTTPKNTTDTTPTKPNVTEKQSIHGRVVKTDSNLLGQRMKQVYGPEGNIRKEKRITHLDDHIIKEKTKGDITSEDSKDFKVKRRVRKKGGTGIGAAIKQAIAKRKKRRAEKKAEKNK